MSFLWGGMILTGIVYAIFTGRLTEITEGLLQSSKEAVNLCIFMAGITAVWTGIMRIAEKSGLIQQMTVIFHPVIKFLFPALKKDSEEQKYISLNFISNMLGLGWAATPAGLKAMQLLEKKNREECRRNGEASDKASHEMCTFLILNVSSLQLIPVSMIAYRSQYGSVAPTAITGPAIITTFVSTLTAVIFCKWMGRK